MHGIKQSLNYRRLIKYKTSRDYEENNGYDNNTGELTEEQQKEIFNKHIKDSLYD